MAFKLTESSIKRGIKEALEEIFPTKKSTLYECINRTSSWGESQKLNSFPKIEVNESKILLSEGIDFEPNPNERGGIIVLSTDVNAVKLSNNKITNWLKQRTATLKNRVKATPKNDKVISKNGLVGCAIGHYLNGRYTAKNGKQYGENSLSIEIIGIDIEKLIGIAEELCADFKQESVLVKDFSSGRVFFVNP